MHGRASVFVPKNMMCFFGVFWFLFGVFGPLQSDHTGPAAVGNQHHQLTYLTRDDGRTADGWIGDTRHPVTAERKLISLF